MEWGYRFQCLRQSRWWPDLALQSRWRTPGLGGDYEFPHWGSHHVVAASKTLGRGWNIATNWGSAWDGTLPDPSLTYTANLSRNLGPIWSVFAEHYGYLYQSRSHPLWNLGAACLLRPQLLVDISLGAAHARQLASAFLSVGVTYKTHPQKKP